MITAKAENIKQSVAPEEIAELQKLERRKIVGDMIVSVPELMRTDRMLLRWLSKILISARTPESAIKRWHALETKRDRPLTARQLKEVGVSNEVIIELFLSVKAKLAEIEELLSEQLVERVTGNYGHYWNDRYESRQKPKRSLDILKKSGVKVAISADQLASFIPLNLDDLACPILDKVKNQKIASINGFTDSKVSLTIHDIFDHFWFYSFLEDNGIFEQYQEFFNLVGNPQSTDIFSREGELAASVAFDYRTFSVSETDYEPLFSLAQIKRILEKHYPTRKPTSNQERVLALLEEIPATSEEGKCLAFVVSGLTIELMEQRRKHGFIRTLDEKFQPNGVLHIMDAEYVALVVESNHLLFAEREQVDAVLLNISVAIEEYLLRVLQHDGQKELVMTIETLRNFDLKNTIVSPVTVEWIRHNLGFAANRRDLC